MFSKLYRTDLRQPALAGAIYYWFFWSFVATYDPFLNVYLAELGLSGVELGLLVMVMPLLSIVLAPMVSAFADRHGRRLRVLTLAAIGWAAVLLLLPIPRTFWGVFPLIVLLAVFRSPTLPIGDSVIASTAARHNIGYGNLRMWGSLGFAIFSVVCGVLWEQLGYGPMFLVAAVTAVPLLLVIQLQEEGPRVVAEERGPIAEILRDKGLLVLYTVAFLGGASLITTYTFGGVYMGQLGGGGTAVGLMFGLSALAEVPVMQYSSRIIAWLSAPWALVGTFLVMAVAMVGHAVAWDPAVLIAASVVKGLGVGMFLVAIIRTVNERAPLAWSSTAQSVASGSMFGLAPLLTSVLSGYVLDRWGGFALYSAAAVSVMIAVVLLLVAIRANWFEPRSEK